MGRETRDKEPSDRSRELQLFAKAAFRELVGVDEIHGIKVLEEDSSLLMFGVRCFSFAPCCCYEPLRASIGVNQDPSSGKPRLSSNSRSACSKLNSGSEGVPAAAMVWL